MQSLILVAILFSVATAQFENGFVKILEEQRFQDGATFGNFRNQEDGIKYKEETNAQGIRTGFWEYPDETGQIKRVEFEAGPGIGFRILNSNIVAPTSLPRGTVEPLNAHRQNLKTTQPRQQFQSAPQPRPQIQPAHRPQPQFQPAHRPQPQFQPAPRPQPQFQPAQPRPQFQPQPIPIQQRIQSLQKQPESINLFDYPADLQFFRDAGGHRFKFTAV